MFALVVAGLGVSSAGGTERVERKVRCALKSGTLEVSSNGPDTVIARRGASIVVSDFKGERACEGGDPTVDNVDTIVVEDTDRATLNMREGLFEPGATPEADGSSEIEIEIQFGSLRNVDVLLGRGSQKVRMGALAGGGAGVNLNAQDEEAGNEDVDLTTLPRDGFRAKISLSVATGRGPDRLLARGGPGFDGPWRMDFLDLGGGAGRDRVLGPHTFFNLLIGGPGADRIRGGRDTDVIAGDGGRDSISAGRGQDLLVLDDGARDRTDCGGGRDSFAADAKDRLRRCEEDLDRVDRRRLEQLRVRD